MRGRCAFGVWAVIGGAAESIRRLQTKQLRASGRLPAVISICLVLGRSELLEESLIDSVGHVLDVAGHPLERPLVDDYFLINAVF